MKCAYALGLSRRAAAATRLAPLSDSGTSDPWAPSCTGGPVSEAALEDWIAAIDHLRARGLPADPPIHVQRELWRRGGRGRELICQLRGISADDGTGSGNE